MVKSENRTKSTSTQRLGSVRYIMTVISQFVLLQAFAFNDVHAVYSTPRGSAENASFIMDVELCVLKKKPNSGAREGGAGLTPRRHAPPAGPAPARTRIWLPFFSYLQKPKNRQN